MAIGKSRQFVPAVLASGHLSAALSAAVDAAQSTTRQGDLRFRVERTLPDGSTHEVYQTPRELDTICDLSEPHLDVSVGFGDTSTDWHFIHVAGGNPGTAGVTVQAPTAHAADAMLDAFVASAGLKPYVRPAARPESPKPDAANTVSPPSKPPLRPQFQRRLKTFLAYRFDSQETETAARDLQRFLDLLDVEVMSGRSYEPRSIRTKVEDRLSGLDFLVLLIGPDGESPWTRDEINTARSKGVPVVPLVVQGATFATGLFGDVEFIPYAPGHIGDTFLSLLEAVVFVRRTS